MNLDRINGITGDVAIKAPVRVTAAANIALSGLQIIDGVQLVAGDRVFPRAQTVAADNGIWVAATSSWSRALDFDGAFDVVQGTLIPVYAGTVNGGATWQFRRSGAITVGSTSLSFTQVSPPSFGSAA